MNIKSIRINNILSIEDAYVEFDNSGLVLVSGFNYDAQRANGAGKTAIFNAITFALYDKLPRKVTATEIVRRGAKNGFAEAILRVGDDTYSVRRSRPKGLIVKKNDVIVDITQEELESIFKLTYSQYLIAAYCAQGSSSRFLSINDADKKQFLLQLLNLEEFSSCKTIADAKVKVFQEEDAVLKSKVDSLESKIDAYNESLIDENVYNYHIEAGNKVITDMTNELITVQSVPRPDLSKYQKLEDDLSLKRTELTKARTKREMLHEQYKKINAKIRPFDQSDTCRSCGSSLDTSAAKTAHECEMEERLHELKQIKSQIDSLDQLLSKEQQINELSSKLKDKKKTESRDYEISSIKSTELQSKILLKQKEVQDLILKLQNNSELESKIKILHDNCVKIVNSRGFITREIELYKTISAIYSPTGAQAYILDSVVDSFNERVLEYINLLWSNVSYELTSYKENLKGDVTAKFSEHLVMDGKDISIGSLSGGEFRALSLCVDFALIDVIERQFGISLSPVVLDEPFDGLDGVGRELIVELLERLSNDRQVVVIDHAAELKSMFSKVINVEKRNGISTISLQA